MFRIKLLTFVIKKDAIDKLLVFQMVGILGGVGVGWRRLFGGFFVLFCCFAGEGGGGVVGGERGCWVLRFFCFGSEILCKKSYSTLLK